jgi:hypothetical protein
MNRDPGIELSESIFMLHFDIEASRNGRTLLIETKVPTPQTETRMSELAEQLSTALERHQVLNPKVDDPEVVLAVPGILPKSKMTAPLWSGLEIWDGPYLYHWAKELGVPVPPYVMGEDSPDERAIDREEHSMVRRLRNILPGNARWREYEQFCEDLLNFLFVPPLAPAISQSRDEHQANRRDFILPNYALDGGFWQFMRQHYSAYYVVAEVKNLTHKSGKEEILQVANYLSRHGTGLFALILARSDLDRTGKWIRREQWVLHDKLIVALDDDDVIQMVKTKLVGGDPAELVRQKIEDFRLGM